MRRCARFVLVTALLCHAGNGRGDSIVQTSHNLSVSGPGPVKATTETQVCVFCHTPHDSNPAGPLWNHKLSSGVTYIKYTSPTMVSYTSQAAAPDPNGASKLCLSCHDGTVALGAVSSKPAGIALQNAKLQLVPGDPGYVGTDLSKTHPISFVVTDQIVAARNANTAPGLALNSVSGMRADPAVHLDGQNRVQCTSCHDAHSDANYATSGVHFYRKPELTDACVVCHMTTQADMGPHDQPTLSAPASPTTTAGTTGTTGTTATTGATTTTSGATATSTSGTTSTTGSTSTSGTGTTTTGSTTLSPTASAIRSPLPKPRLNTDPSSGRAAPSQSPGSGPVMPGAEQRSDAHGNASKLPQRCLSCHVGHGADQGQRSLLRGRAEDTCYRCHGPGRGEEQRAGRLAPDARTSDLVVEFQKPSHHPIEFPGDHKENERLPESNPNARRHVLCLDCHDPHATLARQVAPPGSQPKASPTRRFSTEAQLCLLCHGPAANRPARQPDVARQFSAASYHPVLGAGRGSRVPSLIVPLTTASVIGCTDCHGNDNVSGPAGPHGSIYAPLLARNYQRDDNQPESPSRYDLCYHCHDRGSILAGASFPLHRKHVMEQRAPCSACHSAHGSDSPSLVEFDPAIVRPNAKGIRAFTSQGSGGGQCYLSCHGANHDPESYCGPGTLCPKSLRARQSTLAAQPSPIPRAESLFPGWPSP